MSKKIFIILGCLIVFLGVGYFAYSHIEAKGKVTAEDYYFDADSREYLQNMTVYTDQEYTCDGYIVSLDSSIYDEETDVAYCVFSVVQEDGGNEFLKYDKDLGNSFGENACLCLDTRLSGTYKINQKLDGNTLYIMYFYSSTDSSEEYKGKIYLLDSRQNQTINTLSDYVFELRGSDSKTGEGEEIKAAISPIAISLKSKKAIEIHSLKLIDKDNNEIIILENGEMKKEGGNHKGKYDDVEEYKYFFKNAIDISNIKSIEVNDTIIELGIAS